MNETNIIQVQESLRSFEATAKKLEEILEALSAELPKSINPGQNENYTVAETAQILKTSTKSVYRLIARGLLKANSSLRHLRITKEELNRFLRS